MAAYNKFQATAEHWLHGVYQSDTDQFAVALITNAEAPTATDSVLADLVQITYTNLSSLNLTTSVSSQTGGLYTQLFDDLTITASGGPAETFRYIVIYNDTPTVAPIDPLLAYFDYGSDLTLADGESITIDFTTSIFTVQ